ncbi:MAG TPA: excinuclease ABC subunit UvrA, partial [Gemmatimonadaceae bacterium]
MKDVIVVRGARQHNLRGVDLDIPRRAFTVITGPSGSGKSSLAFDTIYAEGQRRYVESLSSYARQFLERMEKPDVDVIEGLSPAVAIEQRNPTKTSRSTVGTATEIYDYLRLLWARIGHTHCRVCDRELRPDTVQTVTDKLLALPAGTRFSVAFPLRLSDAVTHKVVVENLQAQGFVRVQCDDQTLRLDDMPKGVDVTTAKSLFVIVDRLSAGDAARDRITDAVSTAFREGDGDCVALLDPNAANPEPKAESPKPRAASRAPGAAVLKFTERFECPDDGTRAPSPTPQLFSFNSPRGACPDCNGFGAILEYDLGLIVPHPERSLSEGAIEPWTMPRYDNKRRHLSDFAKRESIPMNVAWSKLPAAARDKLLNARAKSYKGIFPFLKDLEEKRYKQYIRVFLRRYQAARTCPACNGAKLQPDALNVRVGGKNVAQVAEMPADKLLIWLDTQQLSQFEREVAAHILKEARDRVLFLCDVGLTYLTLNRATRTLSGGEAQRIGLANSLGAQLVDTLYVLDEPSIGLHPRDMSRLLRLMARLRDSGNTVLVVEHDLEAIRAADYMVELGPGSGEKGGNIVFSGPMARVSESPLTGQYLSGAKAIPVPAKRRKAGPRWLT